MQGFEVVVALGHVGVGKSVDERRYIIAPNAIAAKDIAFSWGRVKRVLEVKKLPPDHWFVQQLHGSFMEAGDM